MHKVISELQEFYPEMKSDMCSNEPKGNNDQPSNTVDEWGNNDNNNDNDGFDDITNDNNNNDDDEDDGWGFFLTI